MNSKYFIFKIVRCGPEPIKALDQTGRGSLKPKQITWCLLRLAFAGLLQVFDVAWVGKKVHPAHTRGAGELRANGARDGGKLRAKSAVPRLLPPLLKNSSDLREMWYILGSNFDAFCHSFN